MCFYVLRGVLDSSSFGGIFQSSAPEPYYGSNLTQDTLMGQSSLSHTIGYHLCDDNSQILMPSSVFAPGLQSITSLCPLGISIHMSHRWIKLNNPNRGPHLPPVSSISVKYIIRIVQSVLQATHIGVIYDSSLLFKHHIMSLCQCPC